jgi:hypothetical protein
MDHQSPTLRARHVPRWKRGRLTSFQEQFPECIPVGVGSNFYPRKFGKADIPMALAPMLENQVSSTI